MAADCQEAKERLVEFLRFGCNSVRENKQRRVLQVGEYEPGPLALLRYASSPVEPGL